MSTQSELSARVSARAPHEMRLGEGLQVVVVVVVMTAVVAVVDDDLR